MRHFQFFFLQELHKEETNTNDLESKPVKLEEPKLTGGRWQYVIGLVVIFAQHKHMHVLQEHTYIYIEVLFNNFLIDVLDLYRYQYVNLNTFKIVYLCFFTDYLIDAIVLVIP